MSAARTIVWQESSPTTAGRASRRIFFGVSALVIAASAALTILSCASMSAMGGMPMPGGWTMSMAWMRMPGQTWLEAAATFVAMWLVMMVAMMLPSLMPALWRYHSAARAHGAWPGSRTVLVGAGYFSIWALFGIVVFPLGAAISASTMQLPALARAVPAVVGVVAVAAGMLQLTRWKSRCLAACREAPVHGLASSAGAAWRHGLRLGLRCCFCCANLMVLLLVLGVMDLRVMVAVTAALTAERLAPAGEHVARLIGAVIVAAGLLQTALTAAA